ncbi:hypothetical protein HOP50_01g03610 [Chloropicon primus]|uniref:Uncharacterized protein n=2 Tax=Chloropicon primus TaxID=1764295 RepID=A0A5B8MCQ6_9CHLO|nr:hypothetical protein A3770_01p03720 [Chloropicon primus]UPQ97070.1 hypothetical protein HOP50_01g03610 [Chloropicon primus]|eukprot:QDZ17854.1 hypothetical protein A3770_01p03720 [Chloropicon primus]
MTVIPEKHLLSQIGHLLNAQAVRGQEETSPSSLGAVVRRVPGEPSPLPQKQPSGISRSEQLLGLQRYLNFPFVPAYVGKDGGVVLDRVVHTLGSRGSSWWATITARLRAQRAWFQHKEGKSRKNSLVDPKNYALSVQTNSRVSRLLSVCANLEFDDFNQVVSLANGRESEVPLRMQAELKQKLPMHQLTAEAVLHGRYRSSNEGTVAIPRVLSADIASDSRRSGLRYQAGVFQVVSNKDAKDIFDQDISELHTSTFLQCAATMEKDFVLWKGRKSNDTRKQKARALSPFELAYSTSKFSSEISKHLKQPRDSSTKPKEKAVSSPRRRMPFSALLHTPYLSFGGVAGVLAQGRLRTEPAGEENAGFLSRVPGLLSVGDNSFWTTRRFFASTGLNMQLGNFSKHLLDFTSLSVKLDTGIPVASEHPSPLDPQGGGGGITKVPGLKHGLLDHYQQRKHMLSASVAQQVFGPLRVRADARCEIELRKPKENAPVLEQLSSVACFPGGAPKPEIVYGLDCQLPYLNGAARFSLWYSPTRKEGLGEIRLL